MPQESNLLSIWLTELPNSQKMSYFEVEDYLHYRYCRTNYEDINLTLCRSVLNILLNNITLKSFQTSFSLIFKDLKNLENFEDCKYDEIGSIFCKKSVNILIFLHFGTGI